MRSNNRSRRVFIPAVFDGEVDNLLSFGNFTAVIPSGSKNNGSQLPVVFASLQPPANGCDPFWIDQPINSQPRSEKPRGRSLRERALIFSQPLRDAQAIGHHQFLSKLPS
jgi:hypothetical protein